MNNLDPTSTTPTGWLKSTPSPEAQAARLDAIRAICRTEGHYWIEVTSHGDQLTRSICRRGCSATRHGIRYGHNLTPEQLARLMPANGSVTVTDIEIIVEPS